MATTSYQKSYSVLGVFHDDDWETVRSAYKRQIRRWHPDRFQDPDQRQIAEDKSKEINLAFQILDEYYRQHGELPPDGSGAPDTPPSAPDPHLQPEHAPHSPTDLGANSAESPHSGSAVQQPARRSFTGMVLAIAAVAAIYTFLEPSPGNQPEPLASRQSTLPDAGSAVEVGDPAQREPEMAAGKTREQEGQPAGWHDSLSGSPGENELPAPDKRLPYITRGSTKQEVLAIQGQPLRKTETSWDYGLSRINFHNGKVTDWYENPMNPLIVER